jgi:uncharacterized protein YbbC (DUF1343 family)
MSGLDALLAMKEYPMPGCRIGFLGHHASVDRVGTHAVQRLLDDGNWRIERLFSPEHGFFGKAAAGEHVENRLHPEWQLPVFSLYGEHRSPPPEWLDGLDLMIVDLQDLGVRCYTYASTLLLMMRACAAINLPMWILDRPTPLAGIVDGPGLDPACESFVGMIDLPLVFGRSQGDLAEWLQTHHSELRNLNLRVFRDPEMGGEARWIPPSPAIVSRDSARLYPVTVWCEAIPEVAVDRGGPDSFQIWTMPDFPEKLLKRPPQFKGMDARPWQNREWPGLRFRIHDPNSYRPLENAIRLLCAIRDEMGADRLFSNPGARPVFFDQLMGTGETRKQLIDGWDAHRICASW